MAQTPRFSGWGQIIADYTDYHVDRRYFLRMTGAAV
jgi:hypothetical protein